MIKNRICISLQCLSFRDPRKSQVILENAGFSKVKCWSHVVVTSPSPLSEDSGRGWGGVWGGGSEEDEDNGNDNNDN